MRHFLRITLPFVIAFSCCGLFLLNGDTPAGATGSGGCTVDITSGTLTGTGWQPSVYYTMHCTDIAAITTGANENGVSIQYNWDGDWYTFGLLFCHDEASNTTPMGNGPGSCGDGYSNEYSPAVTGVTSSFIGETGSGGGCDMTGSWSQCIGTGTQDSNGNFWIATDPWGSTTEGDYSGITGAATTDAELWPYNTDTGASAVAYNATPSLPAAPCTLISFTGDGTDPTSDGSTAYPYQFTTAGTVNRIVGVDDTVISGSTTTYDSKDFFTSGIEAQSGSMAFGISPDPMTLDVTYGTGNNIDPDFWCDAGGGTWVDWGDAESLSGNPALNPLTGGASSTSAPCLYGVSIVIVNGVSECQATPPAATPSDDGGAFPLATCFVIQNDNPLSGAFWTGLMHIPICGIQWLVEPSSANMTRLGDQFGVTSNAPEVADDSASQWLGSMAELVTVGPYTSMVSIQTATEDGATSDIIDAGIPLNFGGHSYTVDGSSSVGVAQSLSAVSATTGETSWGPVLLDLLTVALLVLFFIELVHFMRKILGSNE